MTETSDINSTLDNATPGPWRLRMHPADPRMERPEYPDAVVDAKGRNVVFCCVTMTTAREGEWLANARLIAAAPDMLAALQSLHAFVGVMCGRGPDAIIPETVQAPIGVPIKIGEIMRDASVAIAKASA